MVRPVCARVRLSFVDPYLLGYRLAFGVDIFSKTMLASSYQSYDSTTTGGGFRFGIPLTDELNAQLRYSIYTREITLSPYNNCYIVPPDTNVCLPAAPSLREAANAGSVLTSLVGYTLLYNTLDNVKTPNKGLLVEFERETGGRRR